jgi:hypothetical protein
VQDVFKRPSATGSKRPIFSMDSVQVADVIGKGHLFAVEDQLLENKSDRDYNDLVFNITGATGTGKRLEQSIHPKKNWSQNAVGRQLIQYAEQAQKLDLTAYPLVGVIDTGLRLDGRSLDYRRIISGYDYVDEDASSLMAAGDDHGTRLVEIIQAESPSMVWTSRAIGSREWSDALIEFVDTTVETGYPHGVVNLSFDLTRRLADGTVVPRHNLTADEWNALAYARDHNIVVVASVGNDPSRLSAIAQAAREFDNILVVGASENGTMADYSGTGLTLDLVAPGRVDVDGSELRGTSNATAQVTSAVSQMWAANSDLSYQQVMQILRSTATDLYRPGWDGETGWGQLNVIKALQQAGTTVATSRQVSPLFTSFSVEDLMQQDLASVMELVRISGLVPNNPQLQMLLQPPGILYTGNVAEEQPTEYRQVFTETGSYTNYREPGYERAISINNYPETIRQQGATMITSSSSLYDWQEAFRDPNPWRQVALGNSEVKTKTENTSAYNNQVITETVDRLERRTYDSNVTSATGMWTGHTDSTVDLTQQRDRQIKTQTATVTKTETETEKTTVDFDSRGVYGGQPVSSFIDQSSLASLVETNTKKTERVTLIDGSDTSVENPSKEGGVSRFQEMEVTNRNLGALPDRAIHTVQTTNSTSIGMT